jgi:hypothetical protein
MAKTIQIQSAPNQVSTTSPSTKINFEKLTMGTAARIEKSHA